MTTPPIVAPVVAPARAAPAEVRAGQDVQRDVVPEGPLAIPEYEIQEEETRARGIKGPREPSAPEIKRHWLTH